MPEGKEIKSCMFNVRHRAEDPIGLISFHSHYLHFSDEETEDLRGEGLAQGHVVTWLVGGSQSALVSSQRLVSFCFSASFSYLHPCVPLGAHT